MPATALIQPIELGIGSGVIDAAAAGQHDRIDGFAGVGQRRRHERQAGCGADRLAVDRGDDDVVSAVGQQRCAGEHVVRPHHIECLHAGKADDHHLASHGLSVGQTRPCRLRRVPHQLGHADLSRQWLPGRPWQTVPMAQITLRGNAINTVGELPAVGSKAPAFTLTGADLSAVSSEQFSGKSVLLNIFPSVDTPVCATSVRKFNERAAGSGATVVNVSKDLPFAQKRFCGAEGIENVTTASAFRDSFGEDYGVTIADGPMAGLLARAVVVIGADGNVAYTRAGARDRRRSLITTRRWPR